MSEDKKDNIFENGFEKGKDFIEDSGEKLKDVAGSVFEKVKKVLDEDGDGKIELDDLKDKFQKTSKKGVDFVKNILDGDKNQNK